MAISHSRLDRFLNKSCAINSKNIRLMLAQQRIKVDGMVICNMGHIVHKFSHIEIDNKTVQRHEAVYFMQHKPVGVVCATKDNQHTTVLDLFEHPLKSELHIVGRLDLNTSGLVLLTNDSRWSERLMSPKHKVPKRYRVMLANPIDASYIEAFEKGMYFEYEDITTLPAKLSILSTYQADVELLEGKYHQIKRMFGRFNNPVVHLHRYAVGNLWLDKSLNEGEIRALLASEVEGVFG